MKKCPITAAFFLLFLAGAVAAVAHPRHLRANLRGIEEVPAISTTGNGEFRAEISDDDTTIEYELSYADLEGDVAQSHIHFGQKGVNGGVVLFLCSNLAGAPPGTPACPPAPATVTGTLTAAEVMRGAAGQGIAAGELEEVLQAIRRGVTYVNVHSSLFPSGEIRGQVKTNGHGGGG